MKTKFTTRPLSYFEHVERQANPNVVEVDVIEWPEPIEVKEIRSEAAIWRFRALLNKSLKELKS